MFTRLIRWLWGPPRAVFTPLAPKPVGPYSQAIVVGPLVYGAGQLGIDPDTGVIPAPDAAGQMEQALKNMQAVLRAARTDKSRVLQVTVYFKNLDDFAAVNVVYERFFQNHKPARSGIEASHLPLNALIEIDYVAVL